ncbi:hypothetical protein F4815DRAFT_102738 [Daldinia loculata]|uniref:uncharacterized protein n=1 Tax=Daldinia loculata TaxID=103429 RepID=UPI0020C4E044|nr:uncharacterized protein F4817DRAFT_158725 [Daldinia loculata]KAI1645913.1 hypothetical protein F4817DRAFT_158725 [Daldinia loculata]KAI2781183.1 hypothetical protein F4815DRAFT_102738 [Daldinia loculata]
MSADGHGLPDNAVMGAHDMIHHAEQEEHEHEAAMKRGITDEAAEAEYQLIHGAEERAARAERRRNSFNKVKRTFEKIIPGKH